jgi:glucose/arabinose dehydrogenase
VRIRCLFALLLAAAPAFATPLPEHFFRTDPIVGRIEPTGVYFAHDGRVFVTEKSGVVWVYQNLLDTEPAIFADLHANVHDYWDRGLLGFALDPRFPEQPYVYVQYAFNGGLFDDLPPRWPSTGCPDPTDPNAGCVISGRISRLTVGEDGRAGEELVLVEDWYQQYPSHSVGTLAFGPGGVLYAGGGDGASFTFHDLGQSGNPLWPDERSPPGAGGSLRAEGLENAAAYTGDIWLDGTIIRIDPATGAGAPGNPLCCGTATLNASRIIAYGLRNPFRFTLRPSTDEVWIGDVGENLWEEIDRIPGSNDVTPLVMQNFGWPCFEGRGHHEGFDVPICANLYQDGGGVTPVTPPWYTYSHVGSSDITGLVFYEGDLYPPQYFDSLFFADNSRTVIFNIPYADDDGDFHADPPPDSQATPFYDGAIAAAVQLTTGPGGDVFYTNLLAGRISRLSYCEGCTNRAPSAAILLDAGSTAVGPARTIAFTAANSVDPDAGDTLTYDWDLDGDGVFGDASGVAVSRYYADVSGYYIQVRVTDAAGARDVQGMSVSVDKGTADVGLAFDDGVETVFAGAAMTYTLVVTNHGDMLVPGERVNTHLSPFVVDASWTCAASPGASCSPSGTGDVDDAAELPPGASATYTIDATAPDFPEIVVSHASILSPFGYGDPDLSDNDAEDIDSVADDRLFADGFEGE